MPCLFLAFSVAEAEIIICVEWQFGQVILGWEDIVWATFSPTLSSESVTGKPVSSSITDVSGTFAEYSLP